MNDGMLTDEQTAEIDKAVSALSDCGLAIKGMRQAIEAALSPEFMAEMQRVCDAFAAFGKKEDEATAKRQALDEGSIRSKLMGREMRRRARG